MKNWTLEFTLDFIKDLTGPLVLLLDNKPLEYLELAAQTGCFGPFGDSFYVRLVCRVIKQSRILIGCYVAPNHYPIAVHVHLKGARGQNYDGGSN